MWSIVVTCALTSEETLKIRSCVKFGHVQDNDAGYDETMFAREKKKSQLAMHLSVYKNGCSVWILRQAEILLVCPLRHAQTPECNSRSNLLLLRSRWLRPQLLHLSTWKRAPRLCQARSCLMTHTPAISRSRPLSRRLHLTTKT